MLAVSGARPRPRLDNSEPPLWTVMPEWLGETVFIIGGGPSVLEQDLSRLRDRRVIAINASYAAAPFAEILFFNDSAFWARHKDRLADFAGLIVTAERACRGRIVRLDRRQPSGLSGDRCSVGVEWTSFSGAIDLAVLLGARRIVALGLDGGAAADGRTHHHAPHEHASHFAWNRQRSDLSNYVAPLAERRIDLLNASPGSQVPFWPIVKLEDCL